MLACDTRGGWCGACLTGAIVMCLMGWAGLEEETGFLAVSVTYLTIFEAPALDKATLP